jgi:hypothetical protein
MAEQFFQYFVKRYLRIANDRMKEVTLVFPDMSSLMLFLGKLDGKYSELNLRYLTITCPWNEGHTSFAINGCGARQTGSTKKCPEIPRARINHRQLKSA